MMLHTKNQLPRLGWSWSGDPNFFLHISSSWVKIRLHTKNQLPRLLGSALKVWLGWWWVVQPITLSLPTRVEVELGCYNILIFKFSLCANCLTDLAMVKKLWQKYLRQILVSVKTFYVKCHQVFWLISTDGKTQTMEDWQWENLTDCSLIVLVGRYRHRISNSE